MKFESMKLIWTIVICLTLYAAISKAHAELCSKEEMQNPTSLANLVVWNALDSDSDIKNFYTFYKCRNDTHSLIMGLINNVVDDIRAYWSKYSRQTIINNVGNEYIPHLRNKLGEFTSRNFNKWPEAYQSLEATKKEIEMIFVDQANHYYDNFCPCIISSDGSKSCAPPDMPDQFP